MANHEELLDTIGNMTVLELSEFVDAFKEKFNVTAMAAPMMGAMPGGAGAEAAVAEEKDEFDVVLEGVGDKKIQVIKVVRAVTGLGVRVSAGRRLERERELQFVGRLREPGTGHEDGDAEGTAQHGGRSGFGSRRRKPLASSVASWACTEEGEARPTASPISRTDGG